PSSRASTPSSKRRAAAGRRTGPPASTSPARARRFARCARSRSGPRSRGAPSPPTSRPGTTACRSGSPRASPPTRRSSTGWPRAARPGATDFHLWGLDLAGGGWCACPQCSGLSTADQALAACNAVADTLGPGGRVFHLAYHDTLGAPRAVRPDPRVWAEFAPRERCYAHALDDPACATNAAYRRALDAHLELFAGRVHVFEYYGDAILFGGCAVPLAEVVERDLDYHARAGVRGVSCLVFGQYSLCAY